MVCLVENCTSAKAYSVGYCRKHYQRWHRNGSPDRIKTVYTDDTICAHCGIKASRYTKYLCDPCYKRMQNTGTPDRINREKGTGSLREDGYLVLYIAGKRVLEHRKIMADKLGRELTVAEVVHHIDGDRLNNHPDNLYLFASASEHTTYHFGKGKKKCLT